MRQVLFAPHLIDSGLILLWDDNNGISIDGQVDGWMEKVYANATYHMDL